jgi:mRNA-degrading endonuclease RelE of RelBE toxin-antitoxin system
MEPAAIFEGELVSYVRPGSIDLWSVFAPPGPAKTTSGSRLPVLCAAPAPAQYQVAESRARRRPNDAANSPAHEAPATATQWLTGWSKKFADAVCQTDRKRQGRIFEAIVQLADNPVTPQGDTVKPLTEGKKGYWRLRVGDFRLIYFPDVATRRITFVACEPRGSAYA